MFEFGWMFWILFFAIFFGCGRMCGWRVRRYVEGRRGPDEVGCCEEESLAAGPGSRRAELGAGGMRDAMYRRDEEREPEVARLKRSQGTPLQQLQQRFIDGRITLEEYEREIDRLERIE